MQWEWKYNIWSLLKGISTSWLIKAIHFHAFFFFHDIYHGWISCNQLLPPNQFQWLLGYSKPFFIHFTHSQRLNNSCRMHVFLKYYTPIKSTSLNIFARKITLFDFIVFISLVFINQLTIKPSRVRQLVLH